MKTFSSRIIVIIWSFIFETAEISNNQLSDRLLCLIPPDEKATQITARYEILTAVTLNITVIWDVTPCSVVGMTQTVNQQRLCLPPASWRLFAWLTLRPWENGDCEFFREVCEIVLHYTALHHRMYFFSKLTLSILSFLWSLGAFDWCMHLIRSRIFRRFLFT